MWQSMKKLKKEKQTPTREVVKAVYKDSKKVAIENNKKVMTMGQIKALLTETLNEEVWANDLYECAVRRVSDAQLKDDVIHLSIKNYDRNTEIPWQHKQWIKNEVLGEEYEGLELFPAESRMVNTANQYHIWCLPKGVTIPIGWFEGRVVSNQQPFGEGKQTLSKK
tara:strand:- start:201 stop:698 length:498 start_codon:yes stop_codon:yes gene_type:complete